jgi:hypothetical protein
MISHQVHVFISHSWWYSHHYETLADWLFNYNWRFGRASARFRNYSVPHSDPILNAKNDRQLREAIHRQISRAHVIVIPMGMYATYSTWIGKEIEGAAHYGKPILAVNPRGQLRASSVVASAASKVVGWSSKSVASGVWDLYYNR